MELIMLTIGIYSISILVAISGEMSLLLAHKTSRIWKTCMKLDG